jgi:hypothetical protein
VAQAITIRTLAARPNTEEGVMPNMLRKARLKCEESAKPAPSAASVSVSVLGDQRRHHPHPVPLPEAADRHADFLLEQMHQPGRRQVTCSASSFIE